MERLNLLQVSQELCMLGHLYRAQLHLPSVQAFQKFHFQAVTCLSFSLTQVAHFSKYGLQDSDEEEEDHPSKVDTKKLKTTPVPPPGHLPPQQMALNGKPAPPAQVEGEQ